MSTTADQAGTPAPDDGAAAGGPAAVKAGVRARDTGDAHAADGGAAVTGYRGPAAGSAGQPSSFEVSHTGSATAIGPGAIAVSGHLTMQQRGPQEPAVWPHQVGVVPPRAQSFQHRVEADRLRTAVQGGGTAVLCQVLTGMGGVGKTQLAADYTHTAWRDGAVDVLVWVSAETRAAVVTAYAQAGIELCRADPHDPERAAVTFLAWLAPKPGLAPCRWLVVLDDIADPADLRGLWPPDSPLGRTLVTTRRRDAALTGTGRRLVEVGLFTPVEAVTYLAEALAVHRRTEPDDQIAALAADLGHLPLALSQAAAYLTDAGITIAKYRDLLADRATAFAEAAPDALPDDQHHTAAAALTLSLDRADALRPRGLARPILQLSAFLDPNGIPQTVLTSAPALTHLSAHRAPTGGGEGAATPSPITEAEAVAALRALHRLHLIEHAPDIPRQAVRVHQLTQRAVRDALVPDRRHVLARTAADALAAVWPEDEHDTNLAQTLRANTTALIGHSEDALLQPDAHDVLHRTGISLGKSGQVIAARDHFRHLAAQTQHYLGPDHPDTLAARHSLAAWRGEAGDAAGAASAFAELLADMVRVQGLDHPDTLAARHDLAAWRGEAGEAGEAATILAVLLPDVVRVQGPDHPDTLAARHNLARWRGEAGDEAGAASAFAELLADVVRVQGPDHFDAFATRHQAARWRGEAGDAAGAATVLADLLADQQRVLGPDHPRTLAARHSLAAWRGETGDVAGAASAFADLLADLVRVQGPDHPHTYAARHNLARWSGETGDAAGAVRALASLHADLVRVQGPKHPDTLIARHNLARWSGETGDAAGAARAFASLHADLMMVLGGNHPRTLAARHGRARWRGKAGDAAGAATALADLLADQQRILGPDHPHTLTTRRSLARWRGEAGDAVGAATAFADLLTDQQRVFGPDHPHTLATRHSIARWQGEAGAVAGAVAAFGELLADQQRILGPDHPATLATRHELARWRGRSGGGAR